jgi:peptidyl-prolyl cis-trans isomerase C
MSEQSAIAYLAMKTAQQLYAKGLSNLDDAERQKVMRLARQQFELEDRVLGSPEAVDVAVPEATVRDALAEVLNRYLGQSEMESDLAGNGLDTDGYADALERELRVNGVLDKVGSRTAMVSDIDTELYYHYHLDQFHRPETRTARHILVTVNDDLPENGREAALARIEAVAARLAKDPKRFEEQAIKHSECPTALNGGLLGEVRAGQLYPELDAALFRLEPMQLSGVLTSPMGFHIVRCDAVSPAGPVPLEQVREKIRDHLQEKRRQTCIRAWLKTLRTEPVAEPALAHG